MTTVSRVRALLDEPALLPGKVVGKLRQVAGDARERRAGRGAPDAVMPWFLEPLGPAVANGPGLRVTLLNDCRDQVNFGANVLIDGLLSTLSDAMPTATFMPLPSHWLMDISGGTEAFVGDGGPIRQPRATFPALADEFEAVAELWQSGAGGRGVGQFLSRFEGADLVVLNGEGSIYRTNQSAFREMFLAWYAKECLGIPTVFLNGMIHLTDVVPVLPAMVRKTFAALDAVAVREPCSWRNARQHVPDVDIALFPDSAYACRPDEARSSAAVQEILGRVGGVDYFCFDPGAMPMDHRVPRASGLYELTMRLKSVVPQAVFVNSAPSDSYIAAVAEETGSIYVDTLTDYREYMALVAGAQFVASGRYHNPQLAALVGCPSITFGSANHKVHGACETLRGLIGSPYDGTDLRTQLDAIEGHARRYVAERDALRVELLELCSELRQEVAAMGPFAAAALRSPARS